MAFSFVAHRANICSSCLKCQTRASNFVEESATCLSSVIRICMEGPNPADFDLISSLQLWKNSVKLGQPNQKERKSYKQQAQKEHGKTLIDSKTDSSCLGSDSSSNELHV